MKIKKFNEDIEYVKGNDGLNKQEAEDLFGEMDNEEFGYWVLHYGYKGNF